MLQSGPRGNPAPPPPRPSGISALPHLIAHAIAPVEHVAQVVQHSAPAQHYIATHSPPPPLSQARLTHVAGRTAPVASFEAHSLPQPAYLQAVAQVFRSQSPQIQARVISGITARNAFDTPEYHAIRTQWDHLPLQSRSMISSLIPKDLPSFISPKNGPDIFAGIGKVLGGAAKDVYGLMAHPPSPGSVAGPQSQTTAAGRALTAGGAALGKLIDKIPTYQGTPEQQALAKQSGVGPGTLGKNFAKDAVNLPAEVLPSVATPVQEALSGNPKKAVGDVVGSFAQLTNPQFIEQHPLDALLMGTGLVHGASRLAAAPIRAASIARGGEGGALSIDRPGVQLTGNLTHERAPFSLSPTVKMSQASLDRSRFERTRSGLVPRSQNLRDKLIRQGVGELASMRERIRRVNREATMHQRESAVRGQSRTQRVATTAEHSIRTALTYDPARPAIKGADLLSHVADLTIRRPDTWKQDLKTRLDQVAAERPSLAQERPDLLPEHDKYVAQLQDAIRNPPNPKQMKALFAAAEKYRTDYAPTELEAMRLGHFGADMTAEGLQRRSLMHYGATHMPGVRFNDTLGLIKDASKPEVRALRSKLIAQANALESRGAVREAAALRARAKEVWNEQAVPISNAEILNHLKGPEGTGGRLPAFTSDRPSSRSAFYVSSERRPLPATAKNTLWAYSRGLTDPSHEALTERHVELQGIVDAHHAQNEYAQTIGQQLPGGGYGQTHAEAAQRLRGTDLVPFNLSEPFHPPAALDKAMEGVHPAVAEETATRNSLDLNERLRPDSPGGRWGAIDPMALDALREYQGTISPNKAWRAWRGLNTQFREVVLATSAKHVPGVAFEQLIRDISYGVGIRSWITGRRAQAVWQRDLGPAGAREMRARVTGGGQLAGMTEFAKTRSVAQNYRGTNLYTPLRAMEQFFRAPGPRQLRTAWKGWTKFVIGGTKHALEEQHSVADLGKLMLKQHGYAKTAANQGFLGAVTRLITLHGQILDDAARGLYDPAKQRQFRAFERQVRGRWTDLTPTTKTAVMFSPFGLWWINSVRFLARAPIDQPVKTALLASANAGTQQQLQQRGLNEYAALGGDKSMLPLYEQGGIPMGGKILAQNYYSPFGVVNDPLETAGSLIEPWLAPFVTGAVGVDYLGKPLTAPGQNTNRGNEKTPNPAQRFQYIIDSALSSFIPLYTKASQIAEGGASPYDVSPGGAVPPLLRLKAPATKTPGEGAAAGAKKAFQPFRTYKVVGGGSSSSKDWNFGGGSPPPTPSSSGGGGWNFSGGGGGSSGGSSGGWNFGGS